MLLTEREEGKGLFVLLRGRCLAFHTDAAGGRKNYPEMVEGTVFGEISLLHDMPATATVTADADCLVMTLGREAFYQKVLSNPEAAQALARIGSERLEHTVMLLENERARSALLC